MTTSTTAPTAAQPRSIDEARVQRLAETIEREIERGDYDGIALKVSIDDELAIDITTGYSDRDEGERIDETTVSSTFSTGKQFLASVVLSYVERGLIDLTAPVAEVLPEFGRRGKDRVTPFHLLTHTSGVTSQTPPLPPEQLISNRAVFEYVCGERLESRPGERPTYSYIAGHAVLAELLLEVDGRTRGLTQLLDEELFAPAGMPDTSLGGRPDLIERMAPIVARFTEPGVFTADAINSINLMFGLPGVEMPAAGYLTTSNDLHRFTRMLCRGGEIDGFRLLSPAMIQWCSKDYTGLRSNGLFDYALETRSWTPFPSAGGVGFLLRGTGPTHGPFSTFASPNSIGGWGAGSTCIWADLEQGIAFSLVSTGVMTEDRHVERCRRLGDMALAAIC
jgi:CubicO group peptidase (beta-lactamase class C family)